MPCGDGNFIEDRLCSAVMVAVRLRFTRSFGSFRA